MKILYVGNDSHDAQLVAFALRSFGPDVAVAWTPNLTLARNWIEENPNVAALTVEVESDPPACASFISEIRRLGVTAPVVLVAGGAFQPAPTSLQTLADATLPKDPSLLSDLPTTLRRALQDRTPQAPRESSPPSAPAEPQASGRKERSDAPRSNPFAHIVLSREALEERLKQAVAGLERAFLDRAALAAVNVDLERRVADAALALERAESRRAAEMREAAARVAEERAHANERLLQANAGLDALRAQLVEQAAALQRAEQQAATDRLAAAEEAARRQAKVESDLTRSSRHAVEQAVAAAEAAHKAAEERHASEMAALTARVADQEQQFEQRLAEATARLGEHQRQANERSAQSTATLGTLEGRLADATDALHRARQQADDERQAATEAAATRQAAFDAEVEQSAARREALTNQLKSAEARLRQAEERHTQELASAAASLAETERQAAARVAEAAAAAEKRSVQDAEALDALRAELAVSAQASIDQRAAAEEAARRQAKAESDLEREASNRKAVEQAAAAAEAAHKVADERQASELAAVRARVADQEQQFERRLAEATDALQSARQQAEKDRQAAIEAAATRQAAVDAEVEQSAVQREALTKQLTDAETKLQHAEERHSEALDALRAELARVTAQASIDRQAAAEEAARVQAKAESDLTRETSNRQAIEQAAAAAEAAHKAAEGRHASELTALAARLADQEQQFEQRLAEAAARLDENERQANERSVQASAALNTLREALTNQLADADAKLRQAEERHTKELAGAAARLEALRSELADVTEQASIDQQAAAEAAATHQAAVERQTTELARSAARLEELQRQAAAQLAKAAAEATEREAALDARLSEESARRETIENELVQAHAAAEQAQRRFLDASNDMRERARQHALQLEERAAHERAEWEAALAERQDRIGQLQRDGDLLRESLAAKEDHIKQLHAVHDEQRASLERARAATDASLARVREECTTLQETVADHRRQFEASPLSICRCAPDGTMTQASRTLAKLLGYPSPEQLMSVGVAVFDSADELQWLIDRCLSSRSAQSIETRWRKKDGSRIVVRLVAAATSAGCIDLAAEDITDVRALEEKLRHAQRLEAVARYASEVAGTCENLLKDVKQAGPQWLSQIENAAVRDEGQRLLADVNRVSGFLRQLAEYGDKQKQALPLVDGNRVLHNLAPVLKRVAGDHIELVLPNESQPLNLDVEAEQVARIFVNVAAYARARMPLGGRLLIDIGSVIVDRKFAEQYPSVRAGAHVLFTVTEMKTETSSPAAGVLDPGDADVHDTPGVDLGILQSLVANSGGHLWIAAEPSGDMVLKIHLPRRVLDDRAATKGPASWISRLAAARG